MTPNQTHDDEIANLPLPEVREMSLAELQKEYDIETIPNPHVEELTRADLEAKAQLCEANGESADFYVGVLSKFDAYEESLANKRAEPTAQPQSPGMRFEH